MAIITISRQSGSLGDELAAFLAEKLACPVISREYALKNFYGELSSGVLERLNESAKFFLEPVAAGSEETYKSVLMDRIEGICEKVREEKGDLIILGMGSGVILEGDPYAINIRICASDKTRIDRVRKRYNVEAEEAEQIIRIGDRKHKRFVSTLFGKDIGESSLFDICVNTDNLTVQELNAMIMALISERMLSIRIKEETKDSNAKDHQTEACVFKNDTEAEFAHILDMYKIEWKYEPKTFPVEWDAEGNVRLAFSPDFYLPKYDTYLELTTMDQRYVTKKNKKMRLVKELYPGTHIRIVYKKDFVELVERLRQFEA